MFDNWGIKGLFISRKGTLSLIVLACATTAVLLGKIDGLPYAAIIGTISTIFMWTQTKISIADIDQKTTIITSTTAADSKQIKENVEDIDENKESIDDLEKAVEIIKHE